VNVSLIMATTHYSHSNRHCMLTCGLLLASVVCSMSSGIHMFQLQDMSTSTKQLFFPSQFDLRHKSKCPATHHGGAWGERRYSSYSFTTSALDGGEWSASRPGRALPPGKDPRYPLYRRLGGPQSRSGHRG
jgi:hypothetical protein